MHLISPLAAGVRGCESGTVGIFRRGTGTRATYYTSFEGDGSTTPVADIALDSNGRLEAYVNEVVDVVCKNSAGSTIISFTDGVSASCVEYIGPSFTGTDYVGGATGINKPITVKAALDLWATSSGSTDFEVGASDTPLEDAVSATSGIFYNVATYGAVGDGVANDRAAINSAISAASADGGGTVFFPPGTYLYGSSLSLTGTNVSLKGAGATVTRVRASAATAVFTLENLVEDLTFDSSINLTDRLVGTRNGLRMVRCVLGDTSFSKTHLARSATSPSWEASLCTFIVSGTADNAISQEGGTVTLDDCTFLFDNALSTTWTGSFVDMNTAGGNQIRAANCRFELENATGPSVIIAANMAASSAFVGLSGCAVYSGNSPATTILDLSNSTTPNVSDGGVAIAGWNSTPENLTLYNITTVTLTTSRPTWWATRSARRRQYADDTAAVTIDPVNYANIVIERTTNGNQTVTFADAPYGCELTLLYHNNHGAGGGTITFDTTRVDMSAASNQFTVGANSYRVFHFRSELINATMRWVELGAAAADEPE